MKGPESRYKEFYENDWEDVYGFWHKIIDRGEKQIKILTKYLKTLERNSIKILDVGCGEGDEIKQVLFRLKNKNIEITANDTSKEALEKYMRNNSFYVKQTINKKLENLPEVLDEKFDFILFSHCLYGARLDNLINKYLRLLKDIGVILIFLDSKNSGTAKIQREFWKQIYKKECDENIAEDVINNLYENKIKYNIIEFPYHIYLDRLERVKTNGLNSLFIPFVFRTKNITKETTKQIVPYIKNFEKNKKIYSKTFGIILRRKNL